MTSYPSREHQREDETAREMAVSDLEAIIRDVETLKRRLAKGTYTDISDAHTLVGNAVSVTRHLTTLQTLRHVREWHAADQADAAKR